MKQHFLLLTACLMFGLLLQSCKKDDATTTATDQITAEDIVSHNDLGEQSEIEIDELVPDNLAGDGADDRTCANVSYSQPKGIWPNTITIDYGTGCTKSSVTFKGKIIVNQTNKMTTAGAVRTITYQDFFVENVQVGGTKTVTNTGLNASGQPTFTRTGNETLTFPDGTTATRTINHVRTMSEGFGTNPRADDVWTITVNDSGTNREGNAYTVTTTTALSRRFVCPWMSAGVLTFVNNGKTRSLDFGDGTCDRDAVLTLANGTENEIKIRHHWWK